MDQGAAIELAKKYIRCLQENKYDVQQAYLFGSYVSGEQHDDSDIDLAIILGDLANRFITQVELMKISRKFDIRIEPHPFEESEFLVTNPFTNEILNKGIHIAFQ
jgi:predicted nucleotidyltransferase